MENFFSFVVLIAPGFFASEIYRLHVRSVKRNDFYYIGWSVVYSGFVFGLFLLVDKWCGGCFHSSDFLKFTDKTSNNGIDNSSNFICTFLVLLFLGLITGLLSIGFFELRKICPWLPSFLRQHFHSSWEKVISTNFEWVVVFMEDGSIYRGVISLTHTDPNIKVCEQDFFMTNVTRIDAKLKVIYEVKGRGLYLNMRDVMRIEFLRGESEKN